MVSLGLAIRARKVGRKPATYKHTCGFRRAEVIAALANAVALLANAGSVLLLHRHERDGVNIRSAVLHLARNALASVAVVIAAFFANTRFGPCVDPAVALLVGVLVMRSAYSLVRETVSTLLEDPPPGVDLEELVERMGKQLPPARLHHFCRMKERLHEEWDIAHAALEPEVCGCG